MAAAVITLNESGAAIGHVTGKIVMNTSAIAAQKVSIGFVPSRVELFNYTNVSQHNWQKGMGNGYVEQQVTAGDKTIVTTNGISEWAGDDNEGPGFIIGTDAEMTGTSEVAYFIAFR